MIVPRPHRQGERTATLGVGVWMPRTPEQGRELTETLKRLTQGGDSDEIKLGDLMDEVEDDEGPGPVLFLLTLPVLLPTPPGVSMLLALPLLMVAPQIMFGRRELWVPHWLAKRTVKRAALDKLVARLLPPLSRLERWVKPRLGVLTGWAGSRLVGAAATLIALVLVLPIPAANFVPSLALAFFSLGLTRRDGLLILAGYALMVLAVVVIWLAVSGIRFGLGELRL